MVGTIGITIAMTDHSKTKPLKIQTLKHSVFQCVRYSNVWYLVLIFEDELLFFVGYKKAGLEQF